MISQYVAIGLKTNKIRSQILETLLIMRKINVKLCKYKPKIQPKAVIEKYFVCIECSNWKKTKNKNKFSFSAGSFVVCNTLNRLKDNKIRFPIKNLQTSEKHKEQKQSSFLAESEHARVCNA